MAWLEPLSLHQQHGALAIELQYATVLCTVHTYPKNVIGTLAHIIRLLKLGAFINLLIWRNKRSETKGIRTQKLQNGISYKQLHIFQAHPLAMRPFFLGLKHPWLDWEYGLNLMLDSESRLAPRGLGDCSYVFQSSLSVVHNEYAVQLSGVAELLCCSIRTVAVWLVNL